MARVANLVQVILAGTVHVWRSRLKAWAFYSAARDGRPCGVSGDLGARGWGTGGDDDMATQEQQHAGLRARTKNMFPMFVTELTSQSPMG